MVKKHMIALYVNTAKSAASPIWTRIKKSTELTLSMNPETEDYDYIADENPTTELTSYAPTIEGNPLTMYETEDDFTAIWDYFYNLKTGDDAKTDCLIVFMFNQNETDQSFKAWKSSSVVSIDEMNAVDSQIKFNILLGGTIAKGKATISAGAPTFTEE